MKSGDIANESVVLVKTRSYALPVMRFAAYVMTGKAHVFMGRKGPAEIEVRLKPKKTAKFPAARLAGKFSSGASMTLGAGL